MGREDRRRGRADSTRPGATDPSPPPRHSSVPPESSGFRQRRLRAVVAVADGQRRSELLLALDERGFEGVGVRDGRHALTHMAARTPHVLIADASLPVVPGEKLLTWARERLGEDILVTLLLRSDEGSPPPHGIDMVLSPDRPTNVVVGQLLARLSSIPPPAGP